MKSFALYLRAMHSSSSHPKKNPAAASAGVGRSFVDYLLHIIEVCCDTRIISASSAPLPIAEASGSGEETSKHTKKRKSPPVQWHGGANGERGETAAIDLYSSSSLLDVNFVVRP
jgi:hypothetical protein